MNEVKCEVVRDLMPLVADEVASEGSRELVNAHVEACEICKAYYEGMIRQVEKGSEQQADTNFIRFCRKMEKRFKMKRVLIVLAAMAFLLCLVCGAWFYYDTSNVHIPMKPEEAMAWLYVDNDGEVACKIEMAENQNWYSMLGTQMIDGRYYITPYKPQYQFLNKGHGTGFHEVSNLDMVWKDGQLYYRVEEWEMVFDEATGSHKEQCSGRLIPIEYVRWGQPNAYTTLYEQGDILPTEKELQAELSK